jgi:phosphomannomutase/phosphoglucomutase
MTLAQRLFGTNGIRGIVNQELTPEKTMKIACSIGTFFQKGKLLVGNDARTSGQMLSTTVTAGLNATGCKVLYAGLAPTPALQYAVKKHRLDGAVIVTASHNPPEYNGMKVVWKDGIELSREQEVEIEKTFFKDKMKYAKWDEMGPKNALMGVVEDYVEAIKRHVDKARIAQRHFRVVVDGANSVGNMSAPLLLEDLECQVKVINRQIDGTFPGRLPEPRPENLHDLTLAVRAFKADLGVAFDGDADRSIFADEHGKIYWGDKTFALVERDFLTENPGEKIVTPVSSSTLIKDVADTCGGEIVWTKVGSVTVSRTMKELKAKLGGEENGGIFYGPHQPVRDGAMATALILNVMAKTGEKLSKLLGELPQYFIEKDEVESKEELKDKVLQELIRQTRGQNMNTIDGVKIWFEDKSAILLRPSGTEPFFRLYAEARTEKRAMNLVDQFRLKLKRIIASLRT